MHPLKIFVIAGEASGDVLGGAILQALSHHTDRSLDIRGIGGDAMKEAGLKGSLVIMRDLAVMGIAEVLPKIPFLLRTISRTVRAAEEFKPDLVLSIDAPDLSFRIQKKLRARGNFRGKQIHVVAPSVWAWRPDRARHIAGFLDGLICFFPFEPPYFTAHDLPAIHMGHPAINTPIAWADPAPLRRALDLGEDTPVVGMYLGSRAGSVERHAETFIEAINILARGCPGMRVLVPTFPAYADRVRTLCAGLTVRHHIMTDPLLKPVAMRACDAALAVSGTVGLELAIANVPHVVGYRMSGLTHFIARRMVKKGQFAHLANIVLNKMVVPECVQEDCTPDRLAQALSPMIWNEEMRAAQRVAFADVRRLIGAEDQQKPADKAAEFILSCIG